MSKKWIQINTSINPNPLIQKNDVVAVDGTTREELARILLHRFSHYQPERKGLWIDGYAMDGNLLAYVFNHEHSIHDMPSANLWRFVDVPLIGILKWAETNGETGKCEISAYRRQADGEYNLHEDYLPVEVNLLERIKKMPAKKAEGYFIKYKEPQAGYDDIKDILLGRTAKMKPSMNLIFSEKLGLP